MSALVNGETTGTLPESKSPLKNGAFANTGSLDNVDQTDQITNGSNNNKLPKRCDSSILESSQDVLLADKSSIVMNGDASIAEDSILCNDMSNSIVLDDSVTVVPNADLYVPGQLMWARIGSYPYWPCIITLDPDDNVHHLQSTNRKIGLKIHINYFADNGRHGWVSHKSMMLFEGKEKFLEMSKAEAKRKPGLVVKPAVQNRWDEAVEEASRYMNKALAERLDVFHKEVKALLEDRAKAKKRKMLNDDSVSKAKKMKFDKSEDFNFLTPDLNKTTSRLPRSQSRMEIVGSGPIDGKEVQKRRRSESVLGDRIVLAEMKRIIGLSDKTVLPFKRMTRSESRMGERILDMDKTFDEESGAKRIKRSESRMGDKINKSVKTNGLLSKNKSVKESGSSSDDEVEEEVKEEKKSKRLNLFRDVKKERVCQICEKPGDLIRCKGPCLSYYHPSCVHPEETSSETEAEENYPTGIMEDVKIIKQTTLEDVKIIRQKTPEEQEKFTSNGSTSGKDKEPIKCMDCLSGIPTECFVCRRREGDRIKCSVTGCGKHYHQECLKLWPQAHWQGGRLTCPLHVCQTCVSDNPQNSHLHHSSNDNKLVKCVRCPSAYHTSQHCVPAGTAILTGLQIVCPKHYKSTTPPINTTWCFLCTEGGSLICCDTCPMSFHADCLSIKTPDEAYICEDCESGRLPLYGEIVWAKLGAYRWWPAVVCYPNEIPGNLERLPHSPGEFCVMFFGSNDYHWVHRGRVFLYQDGDAKGKVSTAKSTTNRAYRIALEVAQQAHTRFKAERELNKTQIQMLKPPRYVKLKSNKPFGNVKTPELDSMVACNCNPNAESPCAPESECMNRMLFFECSTEICPAGTRCQNQDFQKCNYPNMKPFHTDGRGWGLRALEKIMQGRFVIEYVGEIIDEAEYKRRLQRKKETKNENFYFLTIDNNRMIDAEPKGNLSRFMNHSCQPNCETQKWTVNGDTRIGLFALKNIEPGEELTFNYQLQSAGDQKKPCLCGAPNCSGFIGLKANKINGINGTNKVTKPVSKIDVLKRGRKALCFMCGLQIDNNEDILRCRDNACIKKYHKSCMKTKSPTNFICPVHSCAECNQPSAKRCNMCCKAWCKVHFTALKMIQHKEQHDDIYADAESPISHADSNNLDNHSLDLTIEEVPVTNCSTPIPKSKNTSFSKKQTTRKETLKNSKTPLRSENSTGNSQSSKKTDDKKSTSPESPEVKIIEVKKVDKKLTPIAKKPSKNSDTENQTPPKLIVDLALFRPKAKNKMKKSKESKKNHSLDLSMTMSLSESQIEENLNVELRMFFTMSSIDKEMVCRVCKKSNNLVQCNGPCAKFFHRDCTKMLRRNGQRSTINDNSAAFKCSDCSSRSTPSCNVCNKSTQPVTNCSVYKCNNYYHKSCLESWPQALQEKTICPQHVCHTCAAKDLSSDKKLTVSFEKMHKCVRCYAAYHSYPYCIPVGSIVISTNSIICPRHYPQNKPENFKWCFNCAESDTDLECTECPVSYHKRCIGNDETASPFLCKNCKYGKLTLPNEVVWVKANFSFECWPASICTNANIPSNLLQKSPHSGEMCVSYLEVNKYEYVSRERIIQFDGKIDIVKQRFKSSRQNADDAFLKALDNAKTLHKQFENVRKRRIHSLPELPSPKYEHIDINVQSKKSQVNSKIDVPICKCDPELENPCGSNCMNRMSKIECDVSTCPAGDKCTNQVMTKQRIIITEKFFTSDRGWGLRCLEPVRKGDLVIEYVGEILQKKSVKRRIWRKPLEDRHIFYVQSGSGYFDSEQKGNLSRFINHSCDPNCLVEQWIAEGYHRVGIFALRDLEVGEELTICYEVVEYSTRIPCLCGSSNCTGLVGFTKEQMEMADNFSMGDSIDDSTADSSFDVSKTTDEKSQIMTNLIVEYKCWKCNKDFISQENIHKCDVCDNKYHTSCIDDDEKKLKSCPWHYCRVCKNHARLQCHRCCNAYCSDHSLRNLRLTDDKKYECKKHKQRESTENISSRTRKKDRRTI